MIFVLLNGGFGNSLCQMAQGILASEKYGCNFSMIFVDNPRVEEDRSFHLKPFGGHAMETLDNIPSKLEDLFPNVKFSHWKGDMRGMCKYAIENGCYIREGKNKVLVAEGGIPDYDNKQVFYIGVFIHGKIYRDNMSILYPYLKPHSSITDFINEKYGKIYIENRTMGIHLRIGNQRDTGIAPRLPPVEKYREIIDSLGSDVLLLIFTDNVDKAEIMLDEMQSRNKHVLFKKNPMYVDLYMLSRCDYLFLAPSSTFSLWASLLCGKGKLCFYPRSEEHYFEMSGRGGVVF